MTRTVGIVIPAFRPDVELLSAYVRDLEAAISPDRIRIELDDPRPGTREALADLPANVTVNAVDRRRGKGAAITAGFCALEAERDIDVLVFLDADGATTLESVAAVIEPVHEGRLDLAVGSRRGPSAEVVTSQSRVRERLGDCFAWLARRLLSVSVTDYQCGAKAINRDAWLAVRDHLHEPGFAWDVELLSVAGALGYRIDDVPVTWADAPETTVSSVGTPIELAGGLARSAHRARRLEGSRCHAWIATRKRKPRPLVDRIACSTTERDHGNRSRDDVNDE